MSTFSPNSSAQKILRKKAVECKISNVAFVKFMLGLWRYFIQNSCDWGLGVWVMYEEMDDDILKDSNNSKLDNEIV